MAEHFKVIDGVLYSTVVPLPCSELRLPEGIKEISVYAFKNIACERLILPEGLTTLQTGALSECKVKEIVFPQSLRTVETEAFSLCTISEIALPEGIEELEHQAFHFCKGLETLRLPASLRKIHGSLGTLDELKTLEVAEGSKYFQSDGTSLLSKDGKVLYRVVAALSGSYTIPEGVTDIAPDAFAGCTKLTDISMPDSVDTIGVQTFKRCSSLTSLRFSDKIGSIPESACAFCSSLKEVHFPASLWDIDNEAFFDAPLTHIDLPEGLMHLGHHAFASLDIDTLVVPSTLEIVKEEPLLYEHIRHLIYRPKALKYLQKIGDAFNPNTILPGHVDELIVENAQPRYLKTLPQSLMAPACRGYIRRHNSGKHLTKKEMDAVAELSHIVKWDCWADPEIGPFLAAHKLVSPEDYAEADRGFARYYVGSRKQPEHIAAFRSMDGDFSEAEQQQVWDRQSELDAIEFELQCSDDLDEDTASHHFAWREQSDGTLEIVDFLGIYHEVLIPEFIDGVPITSIGRSSFSTVPGNIPAWQQEAVRQITSVVLPYTIRQIGHRAFAGCANMKWIPISDDWDSPCDLQSIGVEAFRNCTSLTKAFFPSGIKTIQDGCYQGCTSLTEITVPGTIRELPPYAFANCTGLKKVTLAEGVSKVDPSAFSGCTALAELELPASLKLQDWSPFAGCPVKEVVAPQKASARRLAADQGIHVIAPSTAKKRKK